MFHWLGEQTNEQGTRPPAMLWNETQYSLVLCRVHFASARSVSWSVFFPILGSDDLEMYTACSDLDFVLHTTFNFLISFRCLAYSSTWLFYPVDQLLIITWPLWYCSWFSSLGWLWNCCDWPHSIFPLIWYWSQLIYLLPLLTWHSPPLKKENLCMTW